MTGTVELPVWAFLLILAFAMVAFFSHFFFPSVRWFFRRRMERAVAALNARLQRPIEPFKLMRRQDNIVRLIHDPQVMEAVVARAEETGVPLSVAHHEARAYAREIVPGFSALIYFGFATRAAKWVSRLLYRVRVDRLNEAELAAIDPRATVIFVMNHRSNMDYVLVTWLVAQRSTLSYAVGEWARIWPLSRLIRAMGAYFIRRRERNALYRRVLARYVQMATAEGVTQAIFPEGGLSLDGRVGPAKMGLLSYIVSGYRAEDGRDVVFIPVGLGYDRVLEDRILVGAALSDAPGRFRANPLVVARFAARILWQKLRGRFPGFGTAAVGFGTPVSLSTFLRDRDGDATVALSVRLMDEIRQVVPVCPVPLAAAVLSLGPLSQDEALAACHALARTLAEQGAVIELPPEGPGFGLRVLLARGIVTDGPDGIVPTDAGATLLAFYAAPILQLLEEPQVKRHAATPQT